MVTRSLRCTSTDIVFSFAYIAWALAISPSDGGWLPQAGTIAFADELIARPHRENINSAEGIMAAIVTKSSVKLVEINYNGRKG